MSGDARHAGDDRRSDDHRPSDDHRRSSAGRQRSAARSRGERGRTSQAPAQRRKRTDPARTAAFDVLREVDESDAYANLVLPPLLRERNIRGRDAAFATELTYGTLRLRARYDAVLATCVDRELSRVDPALLDVLRLGAHQVLGMRVPVHAAVSETVALARDRVGAGPAQMVNAVLRRVSERALDDWLALLEQEAPDALTGLATTQSHPLWITRALREALAGNGRSVDELEDLLVADNAAPRVTLVARPGLIDAPTDGADGSADRSVDRPADGAWGDADLVAGRWAPTALRLDGTDPGGIPAVREGLAGVQDEGSQLVTLALADVPIEGADRRWLDLCAGPGGKAALLGALAAQRGASLVANEVAPHRARLVERAVAALPDGAVAEVRTGDGRAVGTDEPGTYDRVLVDAPCTGLGALRRRPESRWRRTPADLAALTGLQRELLASALDAVRPGGVVAYVTCSPHLAETQLVVSDVLRKRDDVERLDTPGAMRSVVRTGDDAAAIPLSGREDVQLWPHVHGTDAMHLTLLRKKG